MAFEVYRSRAKTNNNEVRLSKSTLSLNTDIVEKFKSGRVELAYDRESKILKITPASEDQGIVLTKNRITIKGFLNDFGIDSKGKFPYEYNEEDRAVYVELGSRFKG